MGRPKKIKSIHKEADTFEFNVIKSQLNCINNAVDLPDNQYGVSVVVDVLADVLGQVKQGENIIGDCSMIAKIQELYKKAYFTIQINVSKIDWSDMEERLYFRLSAKKIIQIPSLVEVGDILAAELEFRSEKDDSSLFVHRAGTFAGKDLKNRDELLSKIKMMVYSKFY
jgi:hypothetical protein